MTGEQIVPPTANHAPEAHLAAVGAWTGGTVTALRVVSDLSHGQCIYAASAAGVYRSTDQGHSWQRVVEGMSDLAIVALAAMDQSSNAPMLVWAATETGRLYHTQDGGISWQEVESWAGFGIANTIVPSPAYDQDQILFLATPNGIMRSIDGARSWESSTFGLLDLEILCLACAPPHADSNQIWAGTAGGGIYRSRNAARAWRESGDGLPDTAVLCIAISPNFAHDGKLWAGLENYGIYHSTDGGQSWKTAESPFNTASVNAIHIEARPITIKNDVFGLLVATNQGIYLSSDGGGSWHAAVGGDYVVFDFATLADGTYLAATYLDGVIKSTDQGEQWLPTNQGLAGHAPPLVTRLAPESLVALDRDSAIAFSGDEGRTWVEPDLKMSDFSSGISALSADDVNNRVYLAAGHMLLHYAQSTGNLEIVTTPLHVDSQVHADKQDRSMGAIPNITILSSSGNAVAIGAPFGPIYLSADAGHSWNPIDHPANNESLLNLTFPPAALESDTLTALTGWQDPRGYYQINVWEWNGSTLDWRVLANLATDIPSVLVTIAADKRGLVRYLATQHRLIKLHTSVSNADVSVYQHYFEPSTRITALLVSEAYATDQTIYVATNRGLYLSHDGGVGWTHLPTASNYLPLVSLSQTSDRKLTAVTLGGMVAHISLPHIE